jgi:hypothetical protein
MSVILYGRLWRKYGKSMEEMFARSVGTLSTKTRLSDIFMVWIDLGISDIKLFYRNI